MGLFDDFSKFLETRLEEFLQNNPDLELQALEEQLQQQENDTLRLIADLQKQQQKIETEIMKTAESIKLWHSRVEKAQAANRQDLAQAAQERESALLRQGNQQWGQMQGYKERMTQAKDLYKQIQERRKEIKIKISQMQAEKKWQANTKANTNSWGSNTNYFYDQSHDDLDAQFRQWETDEELERLKKNMGK